MKYKRVDIAHARDVDRLRVHKMKKRLSWPAHAGHPGEAVLVPSDKGTARLGRVSASCVGKKSVHPLDLMLDPKLIFHSAYCT